MKILTFSAFYFPGYKGGGPIKTIKNLFDQAGTDVSFQLITSDRDMGGAVPYTSVKCGTWNTIGNAEVFYTQPSTIGYKQIVRIIKQKNYDLIYLNSFFSARFSIFPLLIAKLFKQKVILGPRGEFSVGALSLKSQKKQVFIKLYKLLGLHRGVVFQASSAYEADDIRRVLGPKVDIQIAEDIGSQEFAEALPIRAVDTLKTVFISRISPMKNLLNALKILEKVYSPIQYDIYGPIEDLEYWEKCKTVIKQLPSNIKVEHKGELSPNEVVPTLSGYDLFFMPTKGENYGHVIAEALCAGIPILIADTTPWRNLENLGIGWDLPLSHLEAFSDAIDHLASMTVENHLKMRKTVLEWAKNKFTQRDAIEANIIMFRYAYEKRNEE